MAKVINHIERQWLPETGKANWILEVVPEATENTVIPPLGIGRLIIVIVQTSLRSSYPPEQALFADEETYNTIIDIVGNAPYSDRDRRASGFRGKNDNTYQFISVPPIRWRG